MMGFHEDVLFSFEEQYPDLDALPDILARLRLTLGKPASTEGNRTGRGAFKVTWTRPFGVAVTLNRNDGASTFTVASTVVEVADAFEAATRDDEPDGVPGESATESVAESVAESAT